MFLLYLLVFFQKRKITCIFPEARDHVISICDSPCLFQSRAHKPSSICVKEKNNHRRNNGKSGDGGIRGPPSKFSWEALSLNLDSLPENSGCK